MILGPNATFAKIDLGNGLGFWNTIPMRRRMPTESTLGPRRSWPSNVIEPCMRALGMRSFMRLKQRSSVLLPQPDGPISAVTFCFGTSNVTESSAWKRP